MDMRSVKFCRSTWEVQIFAGSGLPLTGTTSMHVLNRNVLYPVFKKPFQLFAHACQERKNRPVVRAG
jgi:hypothetical protein